MEQDITPYVAILAIHPTFWTLSEEEMVTLLYSQFRLVTTVSQLTYALKHIEMPFVDVDEEYRVTVSP